MCVCIFWLINSSLISSSPTSPLPPSVVLMAIANDGSLRSALIAGGGGAAGQTRTKLTREDCVQLVLRTLDKAAGLSKEEKEKQKEVEAKEDEEQT